MKHRKKIIISICLALLLAGAYIGVRYAVDRSAKKQVDREIERISSVADIRYDTVHVDLFGKSIRFQAVRLSPRFTDDHILVDKLILFQPESTSDAVEQIHVRLNGVRVDPLQPGGILKPFLADIGYEDARVNLECIGSYDREHHILHLTKLQMGSRQIAEAALTLRLENIDIDRLSALPNNAVMLLTLFSGISIAGAELTYKDGTLLKKIYASEARRLGQPVETYIRTLNERISRVFENSADPDTRKTIETVQDFLRTPDAITIRLRPERPVSILSLIFARKPDRILKLLGVEVS